jgi:hypothetical protein
LSISFSPVHCYSCMENSWAAYSTRLTPSMSTRSSDRIARILAVYTYRHLHKCTHTRTQPVPKIGFLPNKEALYLPSPSLDVPTSVNHHFSSERCPWARFRLDCYIVCLYPSDPLALTAYDLRGFKPCAQGCAGLTIWSHVGGRVNRLLCLCLLKKYMNVSTATCSLSNTHQWPRLALPSCNRGWWMACPRIHVPTRWRWRWR